MVVAPTWADIGTKLKAWFWDPLSQERKNWIIQKGGELAPSLDEIPLIGETLQLDTLLPMVLSGIGINAPSSVQALITSPEVRKGLSDIVNSGAPKDFAGLLTGDPLESSTIDLVVKALLPAAESENEAVKLAFRTVAAKAFDKVVPNLGISEDAQTAFRNAIQDEGVIAALVPLLKDDAVRKEVVAAVRGETEFTAETKKKFINAALPLMKDEEGRKALAAAAKEMGLEPAIRAATGLGVDETLAAAKGILEYKLPNDERKEAAAYSGDTVFTTTVSMVGDELKKTFKGISDENVKLITESDAVKRVALSMTKATKETLSPGNLFKKAFAKVENLNDLWEAITDIFRGLWAMYGSHDENVLKELTDKYLKDDLQVAAQTVVSDTREAFKSTPELAALVQQGLVKVAKGFNIDLESAPVQIASETKPEEKKPESSPATPAEGGTSATLVAATDAAGGMGGCTCHEVKSEEPVAPGPGTLPARPIDLSGPQQKPHNPKTDMSYA